MNAFQSDINIDIFLSSSSLFKHAGPAGSAPAATEVERQLSAKLHVFYGLYVQPCRQSLRPVHPHARAKVYDLRRYTEHNLWGPYLDDGSQGIDWEKLETIMIVLGHNIRAFSQRTNGSLKSFWDMPFAGVAENSFISAATCPHLVKSPNARDLDDPYGVTGTWMRVVCFLDYTELYAVNFESEPIPADQEREPLDTQEAIRLITLKIRVSRIEPPGEEDGQHLPVVHFTGTSRSIHASWDPNANSRIRGTVRTTPTGAVRWTSFSIYHGEERWRSEGVQIGGLRSARGIMGTWFDKDYDVHGPAGPTAFWKISDQIQEEKPQHSTLYM